MTKIAELLKAFILAAAFTGFAHAQSADVALVNQLSGEVLFQSEGAAASPARAFMKVRLGDRFSVPAGGQIRVIYLQGGRQETWNGPASFRTGSEQSEPTSGQPAAVTTLPASVPQRIAQVPELMRVAKLGRSGGVAVRGIGLPPRLNDAQKAQVTAARDTYASMRAQLPAEDITPELYLYSVLQEFSLYEDLKPVVEEMSKRQPSSPEVQDLVTLVKNRSAKK